MADAAFSVARPSDVRGWKDGNRSVSVRTLSSDAGNYRSGGATFTAAQLLGTPNNKHIDAVLPCGSPTSGTSGATSLGLGVTINSTGTSVQFQCYESGASGAIQGEKTDNEAMPANFAVRLLIFHT